MADLAASGSASSSSGGTSSVVSEVASEIPFQDLCKLLDKVDKAKGTDSKKKTFATFLSQWREAHKKLHPTDADSTTDTFFSVMRLVIPQVDKSRAAYGLKETALAKQYIDILNIAKDSRDAKKLLNYRAPTAAQQDAGDFAAVAYFVLRNRCPERGKLTVAEVNRYLDDLADSNTRRDRPGVKRALQLLLRNTSALEQKWLIRIILKEMKTGLSENSVLSVYHPDAMDLFNVCSSLEKVCSDLRNPDFHLNEASISYFSPFRPMLGERASIDQIPKLMDHQSFLIETKFDGERIQLHKQENQYRYYSRSSKDYTTSFGASQYEGNFTPKIHAAFSSDVKSCILDGEMVAWDKELDAFVPKGDNVDVKVISEDSSVQQCFVVFDVLMINTSNLANCPLVDRIQKLKKVFTPIKGVLHHVDRQEASTKEDILVALNTAIDNREEGLVVKKRDSTYQPDKRKGGGWLKIKPEYVDSLSDQLDLLIIGGYFGVGRRSGMISHFLCAVAKPPEGEGERPSEFHSFCRVGSGYTINELKDLGLKLKPHWKKFDEKNPPKSVLFAPGFKEKPHLWIEPKNSKIVQVRAAEITVSDKFKCGCTLRFPRVEKVRDDKEWYDCTNLDELDNLKEVGGGKLFHAQVMGEDGAEAPPTKKRRVGAGVERPKGVASQFQPADVSDVKEVSRMFEGKEFCVVNGPKELSKEKAERKIAEHGGTFVQNPSPGTYCVLVHKPIIKSKNIISAGSHDVVRMSWLQECLEHGECRPLVPAVMLHTSPDTARTFSGLYDKFGDSYSEDLTDDTIREVFKKVEEVYPGGVAITTEEIAMMEDRYLPDEDNQRGLFRQCKFYLDKYVELGNVDSRIEDSSLDVVELKLRRHGGQVADTFDESVSHVVFDTSDLGRLSELRRQDKSHSKKHHFVTVDWVMDSIESGIMSSERLYEPRAP